MKNYKKITLRLFLPLVVLTYYGCKKDSGNNVPTGETTIELKLDPIKKKYISSDGSSYYSGTFNSYLDVKIFLLKIENGQQYVVFPKFPISTNSRAKIVILSSKGDTLAKNDNYGGQVSFTSHTSETCSIKISLYTIINQDFNFMLYVKQVYNYPLTWQGKQWLANGDWTLSNNGALKYKGDGIGQEGWIRLNDTTFTASNLSLDTETTNGDGTNERGFMVNAIPYSLPIYSSLTFSGHLVAFNKHGHYIYRDYDNNNNWSGGEGNINSSGSGTVNAIRNNGMWNFKLDNVSASSANTAVGKGYVVLVVEDNTPEEILFTSFSMY